MSKKILIFGVTSAIAQEYAKLCANDGDELYLVARNKSDLGEIEKDVVIRGASAVTTRMFDFSNVEKIESLCDVIISEISNIDIMLIAYGTLTDQKNSQNDISQSINELNLNLLSVIAILTSFAQFFAAQKSGTIAVISSVAGDRGRQSNYIYGTAKAGITTFMQGLRNRLSQNKVHVMTIKPGFVDTPMTTDFKKGRLWVKPQRIARDIDKAIKRKKDVIYTPWYWKWIMMVIKSIPEWIFKKLSL